MDVPEFKVSAAELRDHLARLAREVDATRQSEGFNAALATMARFWKYSPTNQWLIQRACPHATRVAGRRTWARLGRTPKHDARPITVLAPTRNGFPFLAVPVFDVSQTEGAPLAELELALEGDDDTAVAALEHAARVLGIAIVDQPLWSGQLGTAIIGESRGGVIGVAPGLAGGERCAVIAHELAHELLHQSEAARRRKRPFTVSERETEAEATSYVVMAVLGLPSKAPTYIAWRGGTGEAIAASMARVQRAARKILEAVHRRQCGALRFSGRSNIPTVLTA